MKTCHSTIKNVVICQYKIDDTRVIASYSYIFPINKTRTKIPLLSYIEVQV